MKHQNFPQIGSNSFENFKNLALLDLTSSNISIIDHHAFHENQKLGTLLLGANNLESIVLSANSLESLTLRENRLKSVDSSNLINLVYLDLEKNLLTEVELSTILGNLPHLFDLNLESNFLSSIDKNLFSNQQESLQRLNLWNNDISKIEAGSFDYLINLQYLDLGANHENLTEYITEAWHFCHSLESNNSLEIVMESHKKVVKDFKVTNATSDLFCEKYFNDDRPTVEESCTNNYGHLNCNGAIEDLLCELKGFEFESITFLFPKDSIKVEDSDFGAAENNSYFKNINGDASLTKYLPTLNLYGTKFDLADLDEYLGLRTENVIINADTVWMSRQLRRPINSTISIRARVVSISEDIPMNMTRQQFFQINQTQQSDQPVDYWANVEEIVTGVGEASFSIRKLGFIEVQKARLSIEPRVLTRKLCSPRIFSVTEYETEHNTSPSVFFDEVQINLLRMAVRTLASTRSNDVLGLEMANQTLLKTADRSIVDYRAYIAAQKLIQDRDALISHSHKVPFFDMNTISLLTNDLYNEMELYAANEVILMSNLNNALGRMQDMNQNFENARLMRKLYLEGELKVLEAVWEATWSSWNFTFEQNRMNEENIQNSINANGEQMMEMQEQDLEEMLEKAKESVRIDQEIIKVLNAEISRYSEEAGHSIYFQKLKLNETNNAANDTQYETEQLQEALKKYSTQQKIKAVFGFFKGLISIAEAGFFWWNPALAGPAAVEAAMGIEKAINEMKAAGSTLVHLFELFEKMKDLMALLANLVDILAATGQWKEPGPEMEDTGIEGDLALNISMNWRQSLENAYKLKEYSSTFSDLRIEAETVVGYIFPETEGNVKPAALQEAMLKYADRGTQLVQEAISFSNLMMHLADLQGDLEVAELNLQIAVEQVNRTQENLNNLRAEHDEYTDSMNEARDAYENKINEMKEEWEADFEAAKEKFKDEIMELYSNFTQQFEQSNTKYITMMNDLTASLYEKIAKVTQHSMVQRSRILNFYEDYCDGIFYSVFKDCHGSDKNGNWTMVPTMSDTFGTLLKKLNDLKWDSKTYQQFLEGPLPVQFDQVNSILHFCNH